MNAKGIKTSFNLQLACFVLSGSSIVVVVALLPTAMLLVLLVTDDLTAKFMIVT